MIETADVLTYPDDVPEASGDDRPTCLATE